MGDNGESHQDALDADEMLILRDFLRAWHDCMGKMKKTRAGENGKNQETSATTSLSTQQS